MINKYKESEEDFDSNKKNNSNFEDINNNEFFKDEDNAPQKVITVKLITLPKKTGYNWEILENKKTMLLLRGVTFNNQEKSFLMSVGGMRFLMSGYKQGWNSVSRFKKELKKIL